MASVRPIGKARRRCAATRKWTALTIEMPVNPPIFVVRPKEI
jgi:hypothetical protein